MSSAYFKTEGLVIKKMPFGEADFLVLTAVFLAAMILL